MHDSCSNPTLSSNPRNTTQTHVSAETEDLGLGKLKCKACRRPIRAGSGPKCNTCEQFVHKQQKCSNATRQAVAVIVESNATWKCKGYHSAESREYTNKQNPHQGISEMLDGARTLRQHLKILSWDADGLASTIPELRNWLREDEVDVAIIQETKLKPNSVTPNIAGYKAVQTVGEESAGEA